MMANPSGNQEGNNNDGNGDGNPNNGNSKVTEKFRKLEKQLRHCPRLATMWTAEEQSILEEGIAKYASEPIMARYANIVSMLQDKTMRDVVIRCIWMKNQKESGKRKTEDHNLTRKNRDKKEKISNPPAKSSSHLSQPSAPQHVPQMISMDNDDGVSYEAIGGATGQLLEKNSQFLNQISTHFTTLQIQENANLFSQIRENILTVINDLNEMPEIMKQMPPLPVKINEELFSSMFSRTHR